MIGKKFDLDLVKIVDKTESFICVDGEANMVGKKSENADILKSKDAKKIVSQKTINDSKADVAIKSLDQTTIVKNGKDEIKKVDGKTSI